VFEGVSAGDVVEQQGAAGSSVVAARDAAERLLPGLTGGSVQWGERKIDRVSY
jgi:hypothetical protein